MHYQPQRNVSYQFARPGHAREIRSVLGAPYSDTSETIRLGRAGTRGVVTVISDLADALKTAADERGFKYTLK